jgi:serine/threonine protein kinase
MSGFANPMQDLSPGAAHGGGYLQQYFLLKSQRSIIVGQKMRILSQDIPPDFEERIDSLIDALTAFERCHWADLHRVASDRIRDLRELLAQHSLPPDLRSSLDLCFRASAAIVRSLSATPRQLPADLPTSVPTEWQDQADRPDLMVCSICNELIGIGYYQSHTVLCMEAYRKEERIRAIDDQLAALCERIRGRLAVPWPGARASAVSFALPLFRAFLIVERALTLTMDVPDADVEAGHHLNAILDLMASCQDLDLTKSLSEARLLIAEKRNAAVAQTQLRPTERRGTRGHSTTIPDFAFLKMISRGAFGRVFLARKTKTATIYAIKVLPKGELTQKNEVRRVLVEKDILLQFESPWVIRFYYSIIGANNLYLVTEYVCGGDLFSLLQEVGSLDDEAARVYAFQLTHALIYLHSLRIIHRDIKPDNVLIDSNGRLKLTDFGLSYQGLIHDLDDAKGIVGTPDYIPPEILLGNSHSYPVDWWALGVLTYECLTGNPPFHADTESAIFDNILRGEVSWPDDIEISAEATDFVRRLLSYDPAERLGGEETLRHPWFAGLDVDKLDVPFRPTPASATDTSYFLTRYEFQDSGIDASIADDVRRAKGEQLASGKPKTWSADSLSRREAHFDDEMEAFSAVSVRHLGGENTERMKKWLEDHPTERAKAVGPAMSQDSVPMVPEKKQKVANGCGFNPFAMDDSKLVQKRKK